MCSPGTGRSWLHVTRRWSPQVVPPSCENSRQSFGRLSPTAACAAPAPNPERAAIAGCGNLALDGNRHAACTWVPAKSGEYPLKAEIGGDDPVTVTGRVHVADNPGAGSVDLPMDSGSVYTGSLGF